MVLLKMPISPRETLCLSDWCSSVGGVPGAQTQWPHRSAWIHDRLALILRPRDYDPWLGIASTVVIYCRKVIMSTILMTVTHINCLIRIQICS